MKKATLFLILFVMGTAVIYAQKIEIKKTFGTNTLFQNNKRISNSKVLEMMKSNTDAYHLMKSAKTSAIWSKILGFAGGFMVGYPIGSAIGGGKANWTLVGVGAGFIVAAIPLNSTFNKKSTKAIKLYNAGVLSTFYQFKPTFYLNIKGTGIALSINF